MEPITIGIAGVIVGAAGALATMLTPAVRRYLRKRRSRTVQIKRIRSRKTPYAKDIILLFREKFPDEFEEGGGISDDFVRMIMDKQMKGKRSAETENIFLAAILKDKPVGFLFAPYYPRRSAAMISYFGVKGGVSLDFETAGKLVARLKRILRLKRCKHVFLETQKRGLMKIFIKLAADERVGVKIRRFDFDYMTAPVDADAMPMDGTLYAIGFRGQVRDIIPKSTMLETLRFLYYEVYGDTYPIEDHDNYNRHHTKLHELVKRYENNLPDAVVTYPAEASVDLPSSKTKSKK